MPPALLKEYLKMKKSVKQSKRCSWCEKDPLYIEYHDKEWGVPVKEDSRLFEFLLLETFQAGLSWITVLRKREAFSVAFDSFEQGDQS